MVLQENMGRDTVEETAVTAAKQGRPQGWGLPLQK